jgi:hypothetical protein
MSSRIADNGLHLSINSRLALADAGLYYTTVNPTPGTPIAQAITTAFDATVALCAITNGAAAKGARVYLDFIRLICGVAPAAATSGQLVIKIDNVARTPAGGSALTPAASSFVNATAPGATVQFGAVTLAAEGANVRTVHRSVMRTVIPKVNDEFLIVFGADKYAGALADLANASAQRIVVMAAPIVLDPGEIALIHPYFPSNAATPPSWELEIGHFEL